VSFLQILGLLATGAGYTLLVAAACMLTGLLSGLLLALLTRLRLPLLTGLLALYSFVFRGVPVLVLLFLVYFGLPSVGLKVPPLVAMMLSLGLIAGAYLAEVFRAAFAAVDPNEVTAGLAQGLSRWQVLVSVELPQMLRFALPGTLNELTTVLKYAPFAYTVGIPNIMKQAMALTSTTLRGVEIYLAVGVLYFLLFQLLVWLVRRIDRHYAVPGFQRL
jgi:polar amino acid transport system permease protein